MATFKEYTSSGGASENFSIPTFSTDEIRVKVSGTLKTAGTHYNITNYTTNGGTVSWISPHTPASGVVVRIYRITDITGASDTDSRHDYNAGSSIKADALNDNQTQALRAVEELRDEVVKGDSQLIGSDSLNVDKLLPGTEGQFLMTNSTPAAEWVTRFPDNTKLKFGTSDDLQLWSDGLVGKILAPNELWLSTAGHSSGKIYIESDSQIIMRDPNGETFAEFNDDSSTSGVKLYQGGSTKLTTTSDGVTISGNLTCDRVISSNALELATDVKWTSDVGTDHYMFWDKSEAQLTFKHSGQTYPGMIKFDNNTACLFGNENWPSGGGVNYYLSISYRTDGDACYIMTSHDKKLHLSSTEIEFEQDGPGDYKYAEFKSNNTSRCSFWGPYSSTGTGSSSNPVLETKYDGVAVTGNLTVSGTINGGTESGKLATIETNADVTDAANVAAAGAVMESDTTTASMNFVVDEDNMSSDSSTKLPTQQSVKKYVDDQVAGVVDSAPGALDTLNELAAALGDDANFSTTITNSIATKLPLAGGTMTGNIVMSGSETVDGRDLSADGTKLDGIEASATADQSNAEIRAAVEAASDSNVFTDADHTKLNGIATSANNYVHPNHSGEVTSTADGATVIADNIVDEANLKISNAGSNGQYLQKQSGDTGGLTWATVSQTDTTYTHTWQDSGDNALLRLTAGGSGSGNDDLTILAGDNIVLTPSGDNLTIAASGGEITVQDEGSSLSTAATTLNFVGAGITASGTGASKTITVNGGGPSDFKYLELKAHNNTSGAFSAGSASYELVTLGTTTAITPTAANTLLISIGGVLQKPNTGTTIGSNDGFCLEGSSIHFGANLTAAPDFIVYLQNTGVGEPSDLTVTTAKITDDAVTYSKIQNVSTTDRVLGRDSSGAGVIEEISPSSLRTMINVEDGATADQSASDIKTLLNSSGLVNAQIDASAAIAGSKITPDFGSQAISGGKISLYDNNSTSPTVLIATDDASPYALQIRNDTVSNATTSGLFFWQGSNNAANIRMHGATAYLPISISQKKVDTNDTKTALYIDASQNVTFGGQLTIPSKSSSYEGMTLATPNGDGTGEFHIGVHESGTSSGRAIVFKRGGSSGFATESMRITAAGDINVHNTTAASTTDPITIDLGGQYTTNASITHANLKVKLYSNGANGDSMGITAGANGLSYVSSHNTGHIFYTAPSAVDSLIERLRITPAGSFKLPDDTKIELGGVQTGSGDLKLWHDNSHSWIENTTGALYIKSAASNGVYILDNNNDTLLSAIDDAGVTLTWDNSPKFSTVSDGVTITGKLKLDDGEGIYTSSTARILVDTEGSGDIYLGGAAGAGPINSGSSKKGFVYDNDGGGNHPFIGIQQASKSGAAVTYINFECEGASRGSITQHNSGDDVHYGTASDYRLKQDEVLISDGITRLKQLKPYQFKWKDNVEYGYVDGFFAHEVNDVVKGSATGTKDEVVTQEGIDNGTYQIKSYKSGDPIYQNVDYSKITPLLTAALKEAIAKIETLETKVAALEAK